VEDLFRYKLGSAYSHCSLLFQEAIPKAYSIHPNEACFN
jgi:hypothetical protein